MKKQLRNIVISACVIVVLGVALLVVNLLVKPKKATSSSSQLGQSSSANIAVFKTDAAKLGSVQVTNKKGTYTIRRLQNGKYTVDGVNAPLSQDFLQSAVNAATAVTATQLVEKNAANLSEYGLSSPAAEVTVNGAQSATIEIGNSTPAGDGCYIALKGGNTVYVGDSTLTSQFENEASGYVDTALISIASADQNNISKLVFGGSARPQPVVLSQPVSSSSSSSSSASSSSGSTAAFTMQSPRTYQLNSDNVTTLENDLAGLSASSVLTLDVSNASLAKYGLEKPKYTMSVTYKGKTTTLDFGTPYAASGSTYLPVLLEGRAVVYSLEESSATFYNWQLIDLTSSIPFIMDINKVESLTVTRGSQSYTFALSGGSDNLKVTCNGKTMNTDNFRQLYQAFLSVSVEGTASKPANVSPYATFTLTLKTGGATKMVFLPTGTRQSFWEINGQGDFYTLDSTIDTVMQAAQDLVAGKTVNIN